MPSVKQNSSGFSDIDSLETLPDGIHFRQAEVWAGLEASFRNRRRRFAIRLSVAAALLLFGALGWLQMQPGSIEIKNQVVTRALPNRTASERDTSIGITVTSATSKKHPLVKAVFKHIPAPLNTDTVDLQQAVTTVLNATTKDTPAIAAPIALSPTPARSRFRVSHANEGPLRLPDLKTQPEERSILGIHLRRAAPTSVESGAPDGPYPDTDNLDFLPKK